MARTKTPRDKMWCRWNSMHDRCYNPKAANYPRYGGRGIFVCNEWHNFEPFYEFFGDLPSGSTIDREDNDGPYAPWNCRVASKTEQNRNKRTNRLLEFNGESLPISVWSERTGLHRATIVNRIRRGWSIEETLTIKNSSAGFDISKHREERTNGQQ